MASVRLLGRVCSMCQLPFKSTGKVTQPVFGNLHFLSRKSFTTSAPSQLENQPSKSDYADYEASTEEFKYVEKLLPYKTVPPPPKHESYPTPSGWIPPQESGQLHPYFVRRTKNHQMPIYLEVRNTRKMVMIRYIEGDIWAFDADLKQYLKEVTGQKVIVSQVHEVARYIRVKGLFTDLVCQFLLSKGF